MKSKILKFKYTLEAIYSEPDIAGNRYWALRFTDLRTGRVVELGNVGPESNIYGILRYWDVKDDWDRSIQWRLTGMKKREFKRLTNDWPYGGCDPEKMAAKIREELKKQAKAARAAMAKDTWVKNSRTIQAQEGEG
jgi:hypothetical protein